MRLTTNHRKWRWLGVVLALAMWVSLSIVGSYSDRAEITPVHCLIPAIWVLLISLPLCHYTVTDSRWFYPFWGLFCGISMMGMFRLLLWSVELHVACDNVMYGSALLVTVLVGTQGVLMQLRKRIQSGSKASDKFAAAPDGKPPTAAARSVTGWIADLPQ